MRIAIRVDSSLQIGTGHVARCLALAGELRNQGARVEFLCRDLPGNVASLAAKQGFAVHFLASAEAGECVDLLRSASPRFDGLVVDHYGLDAGWERQVHPCVDRLLVIDDLADRPHDCDLLLDPNFGPGGERRYRGLVSENCRLLLGPSYALLRAEFAGLRPQAETIRAIAAPITRLMIFYGGIDLTDETSKTLDALDWLGRSDLSVDVILGKSNPHCADIQKRLESRAGFRCLVQVDNMAELMLSAQLAIGAGGTASWERLSLGLPAIVISVADNQTQACIDLDRAGYHYYLGESSSVDVPSIARAIADRIQHAEQTRLLGQRGMRLVEGLGCRNVASALTD